MGEHNQRFDSFEQWLDKASSWLTRHPEYNNTQHGKTKGYRGQHFTAICFDTKGRLCRDGADMQRAKAEGTFPVRWVWPDQMPGIILRADEALLQCSAAGQWLNMLIEHVGLDPETTSIEVSPVSAEASRPLATVTLAQSLAHIEAVLKPECP